MGQRLRAIYRDNTFIPQDPCNLPENSVVELILEGPHVLPPVITSPAQKARLLNRLVKQMQRNVIPPGAPRFTRDDLHERP